MRVLAIQADSGGCFKYRIYEPARVTKSLGLDISIDNGVDAEAYENNETKMVDVRELHIDADVLILQRPLSNSSVGIIEQAKRQGIATVVEIDDDFLSTNRYNVAYGAMHGEAHSNADWVVEACKKADWVTVSTPALEKYAPHGRVSVLRNYVPESIFDIQPRYEINSGIERIGWSGTVQTHPVDLQVTKSRIGSLLAENGLTFSVVGDGEHVRKHLGLVKDTPLEKTGWVPVDSYYKHLVNSMDIGIVPLELSAFNQAKSALKGLEMGALGIPFVASPTREYNLFELYGVGKTVKSPNDWKKLIQRWIDRPGEYLRDAKNYREIIQRDYTYEGHALEWVTAWEKAYNHRKSSL